jgi:hypothetical protein
MTTAAQIYELWKPGLRKVSGKYKEIPKQFTQVFKVESSSMAIERTVEMRFHGLPTLKSEGGATNFDNGSGQRYVYNQEHYEVGLGYAITRKAIDDNLYKSQYKPSNMGLMESFRQFDEIRAANVLNLGTVYDATVGGDGKALFATDHPIDNNTLANRPTTDLALNENAVYSSAIQIRQYRDVAGLKKFARARKLIVPIQLEYDACRLTKTDLRPGTANNDVNAIVSAGVLPEGYTVMDFLTSSTAWFVKTDQDGLLNMNRVPFEMNMHTDPTTHNLLVIGYQRNSFSYENWRGMWGTFPS